MFVVTDVTVPVMLNLLRTCRPPVLEQVLPILERMLDDANYRSVLARHDGVSVIHALSERGPVAFRKRARNVLLTLV